jgi:hypothetical protein
MRVAEKFDWFDMIWLDSNLNYLIFTNTWKCFFFQVFKKSYNTKMKKKIILEITVMEHCGRVWGFF